MTQDRRDHDWSGSAQAAHMRISEHEKLCAIRYNATDGRLTRIERILLTTTGVIIVALAGIVWATVVTVDKISKIVP